MNGNCIVSEPQKSSYVRTQLIIMYAVNENKYIINVYVTGLSFIITTSTHIIRSSLQHIKNRPVYVTLTKHIDFANKISEICNLLAIEFVTSF